VAAGTARAVAPAAPAAAERGEATAVSDRDAIVQITYKLVSIMSSRGQQPPRSGWTAPVTRA
jgi:hypothetical protein